MSRDNSSRSSARTVVAIVGTVFLIEAFVMSALVRLIGPTTSVALVVVDAALLAVVTAPIIYYLVRVPVRRELERRVKAEKRAETMSRLAVVDPLTETLNRRGITIALLEAMAYAERYRHPLSIALIDIDHFKLVNDRHGHDVGDRVLAGLAAIFLDTVRHWDRVGRYGGEEFLLVFPETELDAAWSIVDRIRDRVSEHRFDLDEVPLAVTVSVGVTQFEPSEEHGRLFSRVDRAMYAAKQNGRNRVVAAERGGEVSVFS